MGTPKLQRIWLIFCHFLGKVGLGTFKPKENSIAPNVFTLYALFRRGGNAIKNPKGKSLRRLSFGLKHPDTCNGAGVGNFKRKKTNEKNLI